MRRAEKERRAGRRNEAATLRAFGPSFSSYICRTCATAPGDDPAPCHHYGGASVRKSRRTLLTNDSARCRSSARPVRISLAPPGFVSFRFFFRREIAVSSSRLRFEGEDLVDLVVAELVESRSYRLSHDNSVSTRYPPAPPPEFQNVSQCWDMRIVINVKSFMK